MLLNVMFDSVLNMMFNRRMHQDAELIKSLGGVTKVASRLDFNLQAGGVQRVQNWTVRGIPARIERDHPWIAKARKSLARTPSKEVAHG